MTNGNGTNGHGPISGRVRGVRDRVQAAREGIDERRQARERAREARREAIRERLEPVTDRIEAARAEAGATRQELGGLAEDVGVAGAGRRIRGAIPDVDLSDVDLPEVDVDELDDTGGGLGVDPDAIVDEFRDEPGATGGLSNELHQTPADVQAAYGFDDAGFADGGVDGGTSGADEGEWWEADAETKESWW